MKLIMVIMIFLVLAFVCSSESPTKTTLSSQSQSSPSKPSIDLLFQEWVLKYNKTYSTSDNEMIKRKEIFKRNYLHIQRFNSQGNNSYRLGINKFADLNEEDMTSCEVNVPSEVLASESRISFNQSDEVYIPDYLDWREANAITPVRDQGTCGSCWAIAATAAIESVNFIRGFGELKQLSPQTFVDCDTHSNGCKGGSVSSAFVYASRWNKGLTTEAEYPYQGKQQPCNLPINKTTVDIDGYAVLSTYESSVRVAVTRRPVVATIYIGNDFKAYINGIYQGPCGDIGHTVLIVGFGESDGVLYWLIKNSWGENWGEAGYMRLIRELGTIGHCGLLTRPIFPIADMI